MDDHTTSLTDLPGTTVAHPITLRMIDQLGGSLLSSAVLEYHSADAYAVSLVFETARGEVRWDFGRELLAEGLYGPAGEGDVQLWPCLDTECHAVTMVELYGGTGSQALMQLTSRDVRRFLDASYAVVAAGAEGRGVDLNEVVESLLQTGDPDRGSAGDSSH